MRSIVVLAITIALGMACRAARAAEIAVIESTSSRYMAGQLLDAATTLTLAVGESLTVATENARLIKIDGPHNGPATGAAPDPSAVRRALAQLVVAERPAVGGVGGVRGDSDEERGPDTRPDAWLLHAERSGDQCVVRGASIGVWRETAAQPLVAEVGASLAEGGAQIRWGAGQQRSTWPAQIALTDATVYLLRTTDSLRSVPIRLHLIEPALSGGGLPAAAWLAAKGCVDQARLLLRESPAPN
jgi:hypothetical protein